MAVGDSKLSTDSLFEFQCDLLVREIEHVHVRIAHYDELSFKIRGWAITLWAGIVAFGAKEGLPVVILASVPVTLTFWIVDALFKLYQRRSMVRLGTIDDFLNSARTFESTGLRSAFEHRDFGDFPIHDPNARRSREIDSSAARRYRQRAGFWRSFLNPNVLIFYLIPLVTAIVFSAL
jgi:hypothetical protein